MQEQATKANQKRKLREKPERLAYGRAEAAYAIGVSPRTLDYWISEGRIQARRLGGRVLIPLSELARILREGIKHREQHDTR